MTAKITRVTGVRDHADALTIVTLEGIENEVVANKRDDGTPRWAVGETCVYVSEGSIVPDDVLKERGYWDDDRDKGLLEGKKGNRVKMRRFAGFESRGLLFKVGHPGEDWSGENRDPDVIGWVLRESLSYPDDTQLVKFGDDVTEFFGITEHVAQ